MTIERNFAGHIHEVRKGTLVGVSGYGFSDDPKLVLEQLERNEAKLYKLADEAVGELNNDASKRNQERWLSLTERWLTAKIELDFAQGGADKARPLLSAHFGYGGKP